MNKYNVPKPDTHVPLMTTQCLSMDYHTAPHFSVEEAQSLASHMLSTDEYAFDTFAELH